MTVVTARQLKTTFNEIPVRKIEESTMMKRQPRLLTTKA